jgi:hypothetical protein
MSARSQYAVLAVILVASTGISLLMLHHRANSPEGIRERIVAALRQDSAEWHDVQLSSEVKPGAVMVALGQRYSFHATREGADGSHWVGVRVSTIENTDYGNPLWHFAVNKDKSLTANPSWVRVAKEGDADPGLRDRAAALAAVCWPLLCGD